MLGILQFKKHLIYGVDSNRLKWHGQIHGNGPKQQMHTENQPKNLTQLVGGSNSFLPDVLQRVQRILELNRLMQEELPDPLRRWCRVANYRRGILVIETAGAHWHFALRSAKSALSSTMRRTVVPDLVAIEIRINPQLASTFDKKAKRGESERPPLSHISAQQLLLLAERCSPSLREKLSLLAGHVTQKHGLPHI